MKINKLIFLLLLASCATHTPKDNSQMVTSMQIIDRNGFAETISNKDRIATYKETNFLSPQPYQKVLRVFGRNLQGQSTSKITSYHDNGQLWQYLEVVDGRAHGFYRQWHPNGQLKIESYLIEGLADIHEIAQRSWVFDNTSRVWNEQGDLLAEMTYEKGVLHTPSRYFYPNGTLQKIIPYEMGSINGSVLIYDETGFVQEQIPYTADQKQGIAYCYWAPGHLKYQEEYEKDLLLEASYYNSQGELVSTVAQGKGKQALFKEDKLYSLTEYDKGIPQGQVTIFNTNGTVHCTYHLKEEMKQGEEWEYYPSRVDESLKPKICVHWHEDKLQGMIKTWYPNGVMESQREIIGNKKQGLSFAWYQNTDLMLVEEYENDLLLKGTYFKKGDKMPVSKIEEGKGIATLYSSEGLFLRKVSYEKGRPKVEDELLQ